MNVPKEKGRLKSKLTYTWTLLKEPKVISALWVTAYAIYATIGVVFMAFTPGDLVSRNGVAISFIVGVLLFVGGVCGTVSLHGGDWFLERAGIYFLISGVTGYVGTVVLVAESLPEFLIRVGFSITTILVLLARRYKIRDLTLDPSK